MNEMDAHDRLAAAERAQRRVQQSSRWPKWLYIGYAIAGFVYITVSGLDVSDTVFNAAFAFWVIAAAVLTLFAMRQRVVPRGYQAVFPRTVAVWFAAWMVVFIVGALFFRHNLAWWLPGAVVTSAIMLTGGWLDARAARR